MDLLCPSCRALLRYHRHVKRAHKFALGDATVCAECSMPLVYTVLGFCEMSDKQIAEAMKDDEFRLAMRQAEEYRKHR